MHLLEPTHLSGPRTPIDYFFRSLAADRKEKAVCIVLSGTGSEGALGLRAIKGEGGMAMVQDPQTAKFDGMPRNTLATGLADYSLSPDKMPGYLIAYFKHTLMEASGRVLPSHPTQANLLEKVFLLVCSHTGHDFTYYKQNTIVRRIERRMAVNRITRLADYVRFLTTQKTWIRYENITLKEANNEIPVPLPQGNYIKLSIADEGTGIRKEDLPKIFAPFYTTKAKGHGLGLATSYSIIKNHKGFIDVTSKAVRLLWHDWPYMRGCWQHLSVLLCFVEKHLQVL